MRFSLLAMAISMLLPADSRAQEAPPVVNHAETSASSAALPDMPAPKPSAPGCSGLRTSCLHPKRDGNDLSLQQWPRQSRVADKKFWTVAGGTIGTSLLVVAATSHCRRTVGVENCIGHYGPFNAIQGLQVGLSGFMTGLAYFWKKSDQESGARHPQWWVFPVGVTAFNTFRVVDQYSKHCPRGTRFDGDSCK